MQWFTKDNLSNPLVIMFVVYYMEYVRSILVSNHSRQKIERSTIINLACLFLFGLLASLVRHNNLYVVVISIAFLVFLRQAAAKRILIIISAAACFAGVSVISGALISTLDATPRGIRDTLSIPLQQTARFVRDHPELVTQEDIIAIDPVLRVDALARRYNPGLSDPVKGMFRYDDRSLLPDYFKAWYRMGLRKPGTYIAATTANSYSYYAPVKSSPDNRGYAGIHHSAYLLERPRPPSEAFDFSDSRERPQRDGIIRLFEAFRRLPVINLFYQLAHYTWFLALLVLILLRKGKKQAIVAFMPAFLILLTCIASPVNGEVRYFLPIITATPLYSLWFLSSAYLHNP